MWVGTLSAHDVLMLFSSKNKLDSKYATMSSSVMSLKFMSVPYQLSLFLSKCSRALRNNSCMYFSSSLSLSNMRNPDTPRMTQRTKVNVSMSLSYVIVSVLSKSCEGHTNSTRGQRKPSELVCPSQDLGKCYHSFGLIVFMMRHPVNVTGIAITPHIMLLSMPKDKKTPIPPKVKPIFFLALVHFCQSVTLMLPTPDLQSLGRLQQGFQRSP